MKHKEHAGRDQSPGEAIMLTKVLLGVTSAALVIVALAAVHTVGTTAAVAPAGADTVAATRLAGADWYERHRPVATDLKIAGADWYERHPSR
jgi:hypothetical protein